MAGRWLATPKNTPFTGACDMKNKNPEKHTLTVTLALAITLHASCDERGFSPPFEGRPVATGAGTYYVDSEEGDDRQEGSLAAPWRSLERVSEEVFEPGDAIYLKRGSRFVGCVTLRGDGSAEAPITLGAYGEGSAPRLSNPTHALCSGNAMQIRGDHHIIEGLHFHGCAPAPPEVASFEDVWEVGALHVGLGSDHVIIRDNQFTSNPKAIQSYGEYSLIEGNDIRGANASQQGGFLSEPHWGPIGIQLGIGNQEVARNRIEGMVVEGGAYGADGGAIEIDDGRHHKDNIHIHGNVTHGNMGFLEVSYWDDIEKMASTNVVIEHNTSRDYQSFLLWWAPTTGSAVRHNTIIRDDNAVEGHWSAVFILDEPPGDIAFERNIVVVDDDQTQAIFSEGFNGAIDDVSRRDNCYWNIEGGGIALGLDALGSGEIEANPRFLNAAEHDYSLRSDSPVLGWGAQGD